MKSKWLLGLLVIILTSFMALKLINSSVSSPPNVALVMASEESSFSKDIINSAAEDVDKLPLPIEAEEINSACSEFYTGKKRDWARANYKSWQAYLDKGYSLDEVTLAVEHFLHENFASAFRIDFLRQNSAHVIESKTLFNQVSALFPDIIGTDLIVEKKVPNQALLNLASLSEVKKLQNIEVTVDDVAYFLHQAETPSDDILTLIDHVDDINLAVAYHSIDSISLLDHAVATTRLPVVEKLLILGASPKGDGYLGSTMEWALSSLYFNYNKSSREQSAKVIALLDHYGTTARFNVQNSSQVKGQFPKSSFQFNQQQIEFVYSHYDLDLTTLKKSEHEPLKANSELIKALTKQQNSFVYGSTYPQFSDLSFDICSRS